ncbi:peptidoglycan bridge formation glycyltransferase FemA/FemB family protein [Chloroflexota bacterium]|nr:peptidoglycan bridge formation glycyltransferase FemA/FemB family protein [Chloroflexota bacterium]
MTKLTKAEWDAFIQKHPDAHLLQTPNWGDLKSDYGWTPEYLRQGDLGVMILFRRLPLGLTVAYVPRGPVGTGDWPKLWEAVDALSRERHAIFLRVEPEIWEPVPDDFTETHLPGFQPSQQTTQPPRTVLIDISGTEEDWLAAMKPKTRYNIRLAQRKDVIIQQNSDVSAFHQLMETTGERDAFGIHSLDYYQAAYDHFAPDGTCTLLMASHEGQPLAGLMAFAQGNTAWYLYGASNNRERNRMPTYLLQWEAMRWAKEKGCRTYDLWGVPDQPESELEAKFADRSDGLWGVYRFKRGFGGEVRRTIGTWDKVYMPLLYKLYQIYTGGKGNTPA